MATLPEGSEVVLTSRSTRERPLPRTLRQVRHDSGRGLLEAAIAAGLHKARLSELTQLETLYATKLRVTFLIVEDSA